MENIEELFNKDLKKDVDLIMTYEDDEHWRKERLFNTAQNLPASTAVKIKRLHDHEGTLQVFWKPCNDGIHTEDINNIKWNDCDVVHFFETINKKQTG